MFLYPLWFALLQLHPGERERRRAPGFFSMLDNYIFDLFPTADTKPKETPVQRVDTDTQNSLRCSCNVDWMISSIENDFFKMYFLEFFGHNMLIF